MLCRVGDKRFSHRLKAFQEVQRLFDYYFNIIYLPMQFIGGKIKLYINSSAIANNMR